MESRGVEQGEERFLPRAVSLHAGLSTVCLVLVFGKGDKANISKADTNALAKRAGGLKAWERARHEQWLRQVQEH